MAAATSPATPAASPATSGSNRGRRLSKVHRATEWLKPSFARSSATMSASVRDQMPKPSCVSCQLGSPTTTRFTRTRLSDIVHPVSSSQLTQDPDRVRSFGGYNNSSVTVRLGPVHARECSFNCYQHLLQQRSLHDACCEGGICLLKSTRHYERFAFSQHRQAGHEVLRLFEAGRTDLLHQLRLRAHAFFPY